MEHKVKVLFVENHPEFAATVSATFLQGHALTVVPSIKSARRALSQGSFDVALVDYDLDDGKGVELLRWIKGQGLRVRVIAISARNEGNTELMAAGADLVCKKTEFGKIGSLLGEDAP